MVLQEKFITLQIKTHIARLQRWQRRLQINMGWVCSTMCRRIGSIWERCIWIWIQQRFTVWGGNQPRKKVSFRFMRKWWKISLESECWSLTGTYIHIGTKIEEYWMSPRFFIVMKTVIQIGIRNWVLYDRAERTYRRIFKNIGQSDPVKVNEYLSHFAEKWLKCILAFTSLYLLEFRSLLLYNLIKECRRKVARIWRILIGEPCLQK